MVVLKGDRWFYTLSHSTLIFKAENIRIEAAALPIVKAILFVKFKGVSYAEILPHSNDITIDVVKYKDLSEKPEVMWSDGSFWFLLRSQFGESLVIASYLLIADRPYTEEEFDVWGDVVPIPYEMRSFMADRSETGD